MTSYLLRPLQLWGAPFLWVPSVSSIHFEIFVPPQSAGSEMIGCPSIVRMVMLRVGYFGVAIVSSFLYKHRGPLCCSQLYTIIPLLSRARARFELQPRDSWYLWLRRSFGRRGIGGRWICLFCSLGRLWGFWQ